MKNESRVDYIWKNVVATHLHGICIHVCMEDVQPPAGTAAKEKPLNLRDVREGGKGDAMQIRTYVSCERAMTRSRACRTRALETAFTSSPKPIIAGEGIRTHRRATTYHIRSNSKNNGSKCPKATYNIRPFQKCLMSQNPSSDILYIPHLF
jgi:hypothetical protein